MSETATARSRLSKYCRGVGIDIGAGGDPIVPTAMCIDHPNFLARAKVGKVPTHIACDAIKLPFESDSLDYVYSSHALEDFYDTSSVLLEWLRVVRSGGNLVLFLPDQQTYVDHCMAHGSLPNQAHKHSNFSLEFVRAHLVELGYGPADEVEAIWPFPGNIYSFGLVIQKK